MSKKFAEHSQLNLSQVNKDVLKKWDENDVFAKSMTEREGCPSFVFYEGPPSANGMPGIHHVMARTIKDTFCRYKTMKGFQVKRKAGWDTHGLPVELGVEKALHITKEDIGKTISVAEYNAACRKDVMKFTKEWTDLTHKMGYWVDLENPYITYDNRYIETLWWLLKQLYNKGLLYKGYTIQPYSPAAGTGLSSHELNQPGCYRDVKDTTVVGQFKKPEEIDSIFVKSDYKLVQVDLKKIMYIEGLKDYIKIYTEDASKPILSLMSMKAMEELLPSSRFIRVHRSFIVQKDKIRVIDRGRIVFDKTYIPISDSYKQVFQTFLDEGS